MRRDMPQMRWGRDDAEALAGIAVAVLGLVVLMLFVLAVVLT